MKKIIAILLTMSLCLSFAACGGGNNTESNNSSSINSSQENKKDYKPIELTLENWKEYFEIVEIPVWEENAFGEIDSFNLEYEFRLKEKYYPNFNSENSNVAIEISFSYGEKTCKVDFENQTYELGQRLRTETATNISDEFYDYDDRFFSSPFGITSYDSEAQEVRYYDDVEMIRIQGTLYIAE